MFTFCENIILTKFKKYLSEFSGILKIILKESLHKFAYLSIPHQKKKIKIKISTVRLSKEGPSGLNLEKFCSRVSA